MTDPKKTSRRLIRDLSVSAVLVMALVAVVLFDRFAIGSTFQKVDLVFLIDQGHRMSEFSDAMKTDCVKKATGLLKAGVNCQFSVVPFGHTNHPGISRVAWTADVNELRSGLERTTSPSSDVSLPRTGSDALETALELSFRDDAQIVFFMISSIPFRSEEQVESVAARIRERKIVVVIQASPAVKDVCRQLYAHGGRFFSLTGEDLSDGESNGSRESVEPVVGLLTAGTGGKDTPSLMAATGLYSARTRADRGEWITERGGSQESEDAVQKGLDWLARHQSQDGHWSDQTRCVDGACSSLNARAPTAQTGLAILAFQAGGHYAFNGGKYSDNVRRGLDWLVDQQKNDGSLFNQRTWYEHGIATFALAEACAVAYAEDRLADRRYEDAARRAVQFMELHQYGKGGWQYSLDSQGRGDTSVTGWQMLALKSAIEAELAVTPEALQRALDFFRDVQDPQTGHTGYQSPGYHSDLTTSVGLVVEHFFRKTPSPGSLRAAQHLQDRASTLGTNGDFYTLYNATLAMFLTGGDAWTNWNDAVRDAVIARQVTTGCQRGSWSGRYSRTLATAWAVLTLEVYYRYDHDRGGVP